MILTVILWGLSYISTKVVITQIPPATIALFRQLIAAATLIPLAKYSGALRMVAPRDLGAIASAGFFGLVLYFIFENTSLQYTTASNASMIIAALPIFTLISEALFFRLKVTRNMVLCLLLSMIGVYLVVSVNGQIDFSSARFLGNLLMIGSMLCWIVYTSINKKINKRYPSIVIITYQSLSSIFLFIPFVIPEVARWPSFADVSFSSMANLFFLGVFCSAFAYFFYIYAAKRLGATICATFLNLIPVVTVISGSVVLQEELLWIQICGMGIIMASIFWLNRLVSRTVEN
ncbi:MAG: DMT family transporter [Methanotrichaceae archaeon]